MPEGLPLNRAMLAARLNDLQAQLTVLRACAGGAEAAFLQDAQAIRSARYAFIVLVEAAAAICAHISARRLGTTPESYGDCFRAMGAAGLLPQELAVRLGAMARLRNLVVHIYGEVDDARFLHTLREDLGDVDAYVQAIAGLLAEEADR